MDESQIGLLLRKLYNLNWEISDLERNVQDRINLKLKVLKELREFGLSEFSEFKAYLNENPAATPPDELSKLKIILEPKVRGHPAGAIMVRKFDAKTS